MARRRRKNRTHLKGPDASEAEEKVPKSFVIKSGDVTTSITQLVKDIRQLMEPHTATRLRERPHARLRDYLTIAPTLGVSHMLAFSLTDAANVHMRVARLPQGPTLTFRVQRYSLVKDLVGSALRNVGLAPAADQQLVLNGFQQQADGPHLPQLRLMSTMFQGIFPPITVEKSALPTFRRVLLLSYNHSTNLISMRHFTISVKPHGVSRRVRKVLGATTNSKTRKTPNLSSADDIADYLLRRTGTPGSEASTAGYDSMSETDASEAESDTNAVELPEDYVGRGNRKGERKAVRLVETGPRLELRLIKVVEGLVGSKRGEGETVFHDIVKKSKTETGQLKKEHEERRKIRDARRAEQAANVARKKAEQEAKKPKKKVKVADGEDGDEEEEEEEDDDDLEVEGLSDVDPEEALERAREKAAKRVQDDKDEFEYEDALAAESESEEDDGGDWDADQDVGEVSSDEEMEEDGESSAGEDEEEVQRPVKKRPVGGKRRQ